MNVYVACIAVALFLAGCVSNAPDPSSVAEGIVAPDRATFALVVDALQPSCGTLDCHGRPERNVRFYGGRGMRLDPGANSADDPTTDAEYRATYQSIVYFEPDALEAVLEDHGADPNRLTLVRKARGLERHKGGLQMLRGDPLDRCVISWLGGHTDIAACQTVTRAPRPEPLVNP